MKKQKKINNLLPMLVVGVIMVFGGLFLLRRLGLENEDQNARLIPATENGIQVEAPQDVVNKQTGEVDQTAFEQNQALSDDTSLDTLEAELNNTIILEEDFSDL